MSHLSLYKSQNNGNLSVLESLGKIQHCKVNITDLICLIYSWRNNQFIHHICQTVKDTEREKGREVVGGKTKEREERKRQELSEYTQQTVKWLDWKRWNKSDEWCPALNVTSCGDFIQVAHIWDPSWDVSLLMSHSEEGWSGLISWTRRSPLAAQHRGTHHAALHYGEVPPKAVGSKD